MLVHITDKILNEEEFPLLMFGFADVDVEHPSSLGETLLEDGHKVKSGLNPRDEARKKPLFSKFRSFNNGLNRSLKQNISPKSSTAWLLL